MWTCTTRAQQVLFLSLLSMFSKLNTSFRRVISSSSRRLLATTSSTSTTVQQQQQKLKGWRKYAQQFRDKPASYMTTFAILHEVTAIVPLPIVYYALDYSEIRVPVPEQAVAEGNRMMSKLRTRYGFEPLPADSQVMVNLATSYAVVKVNTGDYNNPIVFHYGPFIGTESIHCCRLWCRYVLQFP